MVASFGKLTFRVAKIMNLIGGAALVLMMILTVSDVSLRIFWKPILGTYDIVSLAGAFVIGFAIPKTSLDDAHVYVDFFVTHGAFKLRKILRITTKLLGVLLFFILSINIIRKGVEFYRVDEVSLTLHVPLYPVAFALGICSIVECMVLTSQILDTIYKRDGNG